MADPNPSTADTPGGSTWQHRFAMLTALFVFPLILVGAGVTSKGVGMAYPDWPTSGGHLVNPPGWWQVTATRWEHGHRLIGWVVGMLATVTCVLGWRHRGVVRSLSLATFVAIAIQGVLGGLRVREISTGFAMVHGIWGQLCFCLAVSSAVVGSVTWQNDRATIEAPGGAQFRIQCLCTFVAMILQLLLGATYRHFGARSALLGHVLWAVVVAILAIWVTMRVLGEYPTHQWIARCGKLIGVLVVLQLLLGGAALLTTLPGVTTSAFLQWIVPSAHVAVGALLVASMLSLTLLTYRMFGRTDHGRESVLTANCYS